MAYSGRTPISGFRSTPTKDTFSGNNSDTQFTLSVPTRTNDVEVFVENIQQEPVVAYSISGTTLTFTSAPPTGTGNIYVIHRGELVETTVHPSTVDLNAVNGSFTGDVVIDGDLQVQGTTVSIDNASVQTVDLGDNDRIRLGTGNDFELYHDSTNNYITVQRDSLVVVANTEIQGNFSVTGESQYISVANAEASYVSLSGDTMTGQLIIDHDGLSGQGSIRIDNSAFTGSSGSGPHIFGYEGDQSIWWIGSFDSSDYGDDLVLSASQSGIRFLTDGSSSTKMRLEPDGDLVCGRSIYAGSAGDSSANLPALLVEASGVNPEQASIAIQQVTSEGDTIIFADYEPYVEYGINTDNGINTIDFTGGTGTNNIGVSKTLYNNSGSARTAYVKHRFNLADGKMEVGGNLVAFNGVFIGGENATNHLGDYEEGSWTPTLSNGGTATITGGSTCTYIRIGNLVFVRGRISFSSIPNNTSSFVISGLPYNVKGGSSTQGYGCTGEINYSASADIRDWRVNAQYGSNYFYFHTTNGISDRVTNANALSASLNNMIIGLTYEAVD